MPPIQVVFFCEEDGSAPLLEWLDDLPTKAQAKCLIKIERLENLGHELRRPEADRLRDDIYELRIALSGIQYRILYFFHGRVVAVLSHGIIKKDSAVPAIEIERAIDRKEKFKVDPNRHTYVEED